MAVAFGSQGTVNVFASHTNLTLAAPASIADGNLLIAYVVTVANPTASTVTAPGGWSQLTGSPTNVVDTGGLNGKYFIFYKIAASESGSYTFTHATCNSCGVIFRYTGVDTTTPFSPTPVKTTGTGDLVIATGFTTVVANTFVIFTEHDWGDNATNCVVPTGTTPTFTERLDEVLMYFADGTLASAGATGDKSHICNSANGTLNPWAAWMIGLQEPTAGGATTLTAAGGGYTLTGATVSDKHVMPLKAAGEA